MSHELDTLHIDENKGEAPDKHLINKEDGSDRNAGWDVIFNYDDIKEKCDYVNGKLEKDYQISPSDVKEILEQGENSEKLSALFKVGLSRKWFKFTKDKLILKRIRKVIKLVNKFEKENREEGEMRRKLIDLVVKHMPEPKERKDYLKFIEESHNSLVFSLEISFDAGQLAEQICANIMPLVKTTSLLSSLKLKLTGGVSVDNRYEEHAHEEIVKVLGNLLMNTSESETLIKKEREREEELTKEMERIENEIDLLKASGQVDVNKINHLEILRYRRMNRGRESFVNCKLLYVIIIRKEYFKFKLGNVIKVDKTKLLIRYKSVLILDRF